MTAVGLFITFDDYIKEYKKSTKVKDRLDSAIGLVETAHEIASNSYDQVVSKLFELGLTSQAINKTEARKYAKCAVQNKVRIINIEALRTIERFYSFIGIMRTGKKNNIIDNQLQDILTNIDHSVKAIGPRKFKKIIATAQELDRDKLLSKHKTQQ